MDLALLATVLQNTVLGVVLLLVVNGALIFGRGVREGYRKEVAQQHRQTGPGIIVNRAGDYFYRPPETLEIPDLLWLRAQWTLLVDENDRPPIRVAWPQKLRDWDAAQGDEDEATRRLTKYGQRLGLSCAVMGHAYEHGTTGCVICGDTDDFPPIEMETVRK